MVAFTDKTDKTFDTIPTDHKSGYRSTRKDLQTQADNSQKEKQRESSRDLHNSLVAKTLKTAGKLAGDSAEASTSTLIETAKSAQKAIKSNILENDNANFKALALGTLAAAFSISSLKGLVDIPKRFLNPNEAKNKTPLLINLAQLGTSSAMVLGVSRMLLGSATKMSATGMTFGIIGFAVINIIRSAYENESGAPARFLKLIGLDSRFKDVVDVANPLPTASRSGQNL